MTRVNLSTVWSWCMEDLHNNKWFAPIIPVVIIGWFLVEVVEYHIKRLFRGLIK